MMENCKTFINDKTLYFCLIFAAITGVITLRQKLDHETKAFYNITITARDLGIPALSGYTNLLVTVSDVDDNAPVFHKNGYTASILENATAGTFVAQVNASDIDADEAHKTILYQIEGGNEQRNFVIGELNGTVFLNWTGDGLDREKVSSYTLTLAAISRVNNTEQKSTVLVSTNSFISTFFVYFLNTESCTIFRRSQSYYVVIIFIMKKLT